MGELFVIRYQNGYEIAHDTWVTGEREQIKAYARHIASSAGVAFVFEPDVEYNTRRDGAVFAGVAFISSPEGVREATFPMPVVEFDPTETTGTVKVVHADEDGYSVHEIPDLMPTAACRVIMRYGTR